MYIRIILTLAAVFSSIAGIAVTCARCWVHGSCLTHQSSTICKKRGKSRTAELIKNKFIFLVISEFCDIIEENLMILHNITIVFEQNNTPITVKVLMIK